MTLQQTLLLSMALTMLAAPAPAAAVTAAFERPAAPASVSVGLADTAGPIFTTARGMALYWSDLDAPGGRFGCTDTRFDHVDGADGYPLPRAAQRPTCLQRWHPFAAPARAAAVGHFTIAVRPDGRRQWAYQGHPLYLSARDKAPGDVNGTMGLPRYGVWRLVEVPVRLPPGVRLAQKVDGLLLAAEDDGRLLFTVTERVASAESGLTPLIAPELAPEAETIRRPDGSRQWTYGGRPLFRPDSGLHPMVVQQRVAAGTWRPVVYAPAKPRPAWVSMHMSVPEIGWVYATQDGRSLYAMYCFDQTPDRMNCDQPGDPAAHWSAICGTGDQCAREWRPVPAAPGDRTVGYWGIADVPSPPFADPTGAVGEGPRSTDDAR